MSDAGRFAADWRPVAGLDVARRRASMLARARRFFAAHDILDVDTPALSRSAVSDPHIESIGARLALDPANPYFLQTSPEYCMKRLLAAGFPDIGQICRVFRDGESGSHHQPEFTMIEWYRLGFGLDQIVNETRQLISMLLDTIALAPPDRMSYRDAFRRHANVDPAVARIDSLANAAGADAGLMRAIGEDRDDWLDLILATEVAPHFAADRLTILDHFPASQASLARLCPDDPSVAERFEIFFGELELGNGYVELTDADEQHRRFELDQERRRGCGAMLRPLDRDLLDALDAGLPECAGAAVGLDRLLMIGSGITDIRTVQHFPFEDQR